MPDQLRLWEAMDLYASFYPDPRDPERLLNDLGLAEKRKTAFGKLSGGGSTSSQIATVGRPTLLREEMFRGERALARLGPSSCGRCLSDGWRGARGGR